MTNDFNIEETSFYFELERVFFSWKNYRRELLSNLNSNEIWEIIINKQEEIKKWTKQSYDVFNLTYWKKIKEEALLKMIRFEMDKENEISRINDLVKKMKLELDLRNPYSWKSKIDIERLKEIPIVEVIESIAWISIGNWRRNIKCCLYGHNDKTASLHIYENNNKFKCFWCHKQWSTIDFVKDYYNISVKEAIEKLNNFRLW